MKRFIFIVPQEITYLTGRIQLNEKEFLPAGSHLEKLDIYDHPGNTFNIFITLNWDCT